MSHHPTPRASRIVFLGTCAVFCALCVGGWARSARVADDVGYGFLTTSDGLLVTRTCGFAHGGGDLVLFTWHRVGAGSTGWQYKRLAGGPIHRMMPDRVSGLFGYGICQTLNQPGVAWYSAVVLPYWLVTAVTSLPFLQIFRRWRRTGADRRMAEGHCRTCDYDLRATPGRCPECGAVAPPSAAPLAREAG